jgi:hypothetical protein
MQTVCFEIFNFQQNENVVAGVHLLVNGARKPQGRPGNIKVIPVPGKGLYSVEAL